MRERLIRQVAALAVMVAAALVFGAPIASAGTLTVNFNAYANAWPGCTIWSLSDSFGSLSSWEPTGPCGGSDMGIANNGGSISGPATAGQRVAIQTTAPQGITITGASVSGAYIANINNGQGWGGGSYYQGGAGLWRNGQGYETDSGISSPYWGFAMICGWSKCTNGGAIFPNSITLTAVENRGPGLDALGSSNLWYQGGHYVWNPPGDPWSIALLAWDPSGVCSVGASVDDFPIDGPSAIPNTSVWQQCPNQYWAPGNGASVDTRSYVPTAGPLPLQLSATNAAGVQSAPSETLEVDNDPVSVSLKDPNDTNPAAWVNHAVTVDTRVSAGPSGVGGVVCSVDGSPNRAYPSSGVSVDGDGVHTVRCTGWNRAVDPQDLPQFATSTQTIHIDESPPSLAFEAQNPGDPAQLVVDSSDSESGVAGGSIQMARAGSSAWSALATSFDGRHLIAQVNDAGLSGPYWFKAVSCDNVGNCASTQETLTLPLRIAARSIVGFVKIDAPAKVVRERVLVGWRYRREHRGHRTVRVRVGGHFITVRLVIRENASCAHRRVRTGRRRWRELSACRAIKIATRTRERVAYGRRATIDGLLLSAAGVPIAGAPVLVQTAPNNGLGQFSTLDIVTTTGGGTWTAVLPAGPSRIIRAIYPGSPTVLPAGGLAAVNVPARIRLSISPRSVPWADAITIRGRLQGGYIPPDGVALRLLVRYPGTGGVPVLAFRTDSRGAFAIRWSYHSGHGIASYPFSVATTATESDYPFAANSSKAIRVTFGR